MKKKSESKTEFGEIFYRPLEGWLYYILNIFSICFYTGVLAYINNISQTQNNCCSNLGHAEKVNDTTDTYQKQILLYMLNLILMLKEFKGLLHA